MEYKIEIVTLIFSIIIFLMACSSAQCAKIIPLTYNASDGGTLPPSDTHSSKQGQLEYHQHNEHEAHQVHHHHQIAESKVNMNNPIVNRNDLKTPTMPTPTEVQLSSNREGKKMRQGTATEKPKRKHKESLMSRILPMMVMPFLVSSSLIPMMLTSLKFMLLKSLFVGKIAIVLLALNALWKSENRGAVYSHNVNVDHEHEQKDLHMNHYGYNGDEEYGAYVNRRMGRRSEFR